MSRMIGSSAGKGVSVGTQIWTRTCLRAPYYVWANLSILTGTKRTRRMRKNRWYLVTRPLIPIRLFQETLLPQYDNRWRYVPTTTSMLCGKLLFWTFLLWRIARVQHQSKLTKITAELRFSSLELQQLLLSSNRSNIPIANRPLSRYSCSAKAWSNTWIKHHWQEQTKFSKCTNFQSHRPKCREVPSFWKL